MDGPLEYLLNTLIDQMFYCLTVFYLRGALRKLVRAQTNLYMYMEQLVCYASEDARCAQELDDFKDFSSGFFTMYH